MLVIASQQQINYINNTRIATTAGFGTIIIIMLLIIARIIKSTNTYSAAVKGIYVLLGILSATLLFLLVNQYLNHSSVTSEQNINYSDLIYLIDSTVSNAVDNIKKDYSVDAVSSNGISDTITNAKNTLIRLNEQLELRSQQQENSTAQAAGVNEEMQAMLTRLQQLLIDTDADTADFLARLDEYANLDFIPNTDLVTYFNIYKDNYANKIIGLNNSIISSKKDAIKQAIVNDMNYFPYTHLIGLPSILPNQSTLYTPMGIVYRPNSDFTDVTLKSSDQIFMSKEKIFDTGMFFTSADRIPTTYDVVKIFANGKIQYDNIILDAKNSEMSCGSYQNNVAIKIGPIDFYYDRANGHLLMSYNSNNNIRCLLFTRDDIRDFPFKYINYNTNTIQWYDKAEDGNFYLNSSSISHEYNNRLHNLWTEDFGEYRVTHAIIPSSEGGVIGFTTKAGEKIGFGLFETSGENRMLFVDTPQNKYIITIDTLGHTKIIIPGGLVDNYINVSNSSVFENELSTVTPASVYETRANENVKAAVNRERMISKLKDARNKENLATESIAHKAPTRYDGLWAIN